jgi:hypothetical protein
MTNPALPAASLALWAAALAVAQSSFFEPKDWKQVTAVTVSGGDRYGLLRLDAGAWRASEASLRDLRLRDAKGAEIPYVLRDPAAAAEDSGELRPLLYDRAVTPKGNLQFMLDFGESPAVHNSMRFRWSDRNFRRRMRIESSENGRSWDLVKDSVLLDFDEDGRVYRTEDVEYPATSRRYLRIVIEDWRNPGALISVISRYVTPALSEWVDLGSVSYSPARESPEPGAQTIDISLPFSAPEQLRLSFEIASPDFVRAVELKAELPGQRWVSACSGTIVRAGGTDRPWIECNVVLARKLRAVIRNGNDSALPVTGVRVLAPLREIVFPLKPARPYMLYAGNEQARQPMYDLAAVLREAPPIDPQPASASGWKANPAYEPPGKPVSEKARGWLTVLLGAILVGIVLTARFLLRMATRKSRRYR